MCPVCALLVSATKSGGKVTSYSPNRQMPAGESLGEKKNTMKRIRIFFVITSFFRIFASVKHISVLFSLFLLLFLPACNDGRRQQMLGVLDTADSLNRHYIPFTSDSLLRRAVRFFEAHGTAGEQLRARYLLGCAYRDLGQAPEALQTWHDAVARADTTSADCDYRTLSSVYSQMATLYRKQLLLSYEVEARRASSRYSYLAGDTLYAIWDYKASAGAYLLMNKTDSAERMLWQAVRLFNRHGYTQEALLATLPLMQIYADRPEKQSQLKQLIDRFESESVYFDEHHELAPDKRQFYFYKAKYLESAGQLDSSEHYYRKIYRPGMNPVSCDPMYRGLLSIFQKRRQADSIAKYAQLFCQANDSSIALNDKEQIARMTASYNYSAYQGQPIANARKASRSKSVAIVFLLAAIVGLIAASIFKRRYQNRQQALSLITQEYAETVRIYEDRLRQLAQLDSRHQQVIGAIRQELTEEYSKNKELRNEQAEAQKLIIQLNMQHDADRLRLTQEIAELSDMVERLKRQAGAGGYKQSILAFMSMGIVKRIMIYANDPQKRLSKEDMRQLAEAAESCLPSLMHDLSSAGDIGQLATQVCLLALLDLRPNAIVHLLGISSSQVANLKKQLNAALFNEPTARSLYRNLTSRYKIPAY